MTKKEKEGSKAFVPGMPKLVPVEIFWTVSKFTPKPSFLHFPLKPEEKKIYSGQVSKIETDSFPLSPSLIDSLVSRPFGGTEICKKARLSLE